MRKLISKKDAKLLQAQKEQEQLERELSAAIDWCSIDFEEITKRYIARCNGADSWDREIAFMDLWQELYALIQSAAALTGYLAKFTAIGEDFDQAIEVLTWDHCHEIDWELHNREINA